MEDESAQEKGFKVSDRRFSVRGYEEEEAAPARGGRRFSSLEGAPSAEPSTAPPPGPVSPPPEAGRQAPPAPEDADEAEAEEDKSFEMLIAIVQTNALAAMGIHPQTGERVGGADPRSSKMFVDLLAALKEKTRGNLSAEEEQLLGRVHSDLQMMYVREVGFG